MDKKWKIASDKLHFRVADACYAAGHEEIIVNYSAYPEQDGIPVDNLDEIPVKGKVVLVDSGNDQFDDDEEEYRPFCSGAMDAPTWLQISVATNEMLLFTKNRCRYLEDVMVCKEYPTLDGKRIHHRVICPLMGS